MPAVCFYFQLHQPLRLRRYSVFDTGHDYFEDARNKQILRRVAHRCYMPATQVLLDQVRVLDGDFNIAFSISGCLLDQLQRSEPDVIDRFRELAETGCVEFLGETYEHSLACLYNDDEFTSQVQAHADAIEDLFGQRPSVFRNTELIYSNELAQRLNDLDDYVGVLAEGVEDLLDGRSTHHVYNAQSAALPILLRDYRLSDDIAFRFSAEGWKKYPVTAPKYVKWVQALDKKDAEVCGLFMDFETFGEHHPKETGILDFLEYLPQTAVKAGLQFITPSECFESFEPVETYDCPEYTSWADSERDLSAWMGNAMQSGALSELYKLGPAVRETGDPAMLRDWRQLTVSDHFYYMSTKRMADGEVHEYFNPYESPYDSYINFMNVLENLRGRIEAAGVTVP